MRSGSSAAELVRSATVLVSCRTGDGSIKRLGSGFLITQGRVLTCAHVIRRHGNLQIDWQGATYAATVLGSDPANAPDTGTVDFPDAAVLQVVGLDEHPTVALTDTLPPVGARLYVYAFSGIRTGSPEPDSALVDYGGPVAEDDQFVKLVNGKIADGQSGGPVLDLGSGLVCAMVKQTLTTTEQRDGGIAIPIAAALAVVATEDLLVANQKEHDDTVEALKREQVPLEPLPSFVVTAIRSSGAAAMLALALQEYGISGPTSGDAEDPEWVGRVLFRLNLVQLGNVLRKADLSRDPVARKILWRVACCIPVDDRPMSWWVPAEAALAIKSEWKQGTPKVVAVESGYPATGTHLARRALCEAVEPVTLPQITAETGPDDLPGGMVEAFGMNLGRALNVDDDYWKNYRAEAIAQARLQNQVIVLDATLLADRELLTALRAAFGSLYFMSSYRDAPAAELPDLVLHVKPVIDRQVEGSAVQTLAGFGS